MTANKATVQAETPEVLIPQSTQLIPRDQAGLPGIPDELQGFTGLEGIDVSAFVIPRIKLVQPTSKEGTAGMYRINLTGDEFTDLPIIVIKAIQARTMWDPDPKSEEVLCRSYDFMKPDSSIIKPYSPICAKKITNLKKQEVLTVVCPQGKWRKDEKGNDVKPECAETYNLLCLQAEDLLPFWITLAGVSIGPVRKYLSAIALRRCRLFQWETVLSSEMKTEPQKHYVAKFSTPKPVPTENAQVVAQTIIELNLMEADIKRTFEAEEAQAEGGEADDPGQTPKAPGWVK
jgi:hypothetical protein